MFPYVEKLTPGPEQERDREGWSERESFEITKETS